MAATRLRAMAGPANAADAGNGGPTPTGHHATNRPDQQAATTVRGKAEARHDPEAEKPQVAASADRSLEYLPKHPL